MVCNQHLVLREPPGISATFVFDFQWILLGEDDEHHRSFFIDGIPFAWPIAI
jgi:hypothetical protein